MAVSMHGVGVRHRGGQTDDTSREVTRQRGARAQREGRHEAVQHGTLVGNTGAMLTEVIPRLCNEVAEPDEVIAPMS